MFYCEDCRKKNDWPESFTRSHGGCEMCGIVGLCYDVPSSQLPTKTKIKEPDEVGAARAVIASLSDSVAAGTPLYRAAVNLLAAFEAVAEERDAFHESTITNGQVASRFKANMEASQREAERLRHGQDIESDWICPNELKLQSMREKILPLADRCERIGITLHSDLKPGVREKMADSAVGVANALRTAVEHWKTDASS